MRAIVVVGCFCLFKGEALLWGLRPILSPISKLLFSSMLELSESNIVLRTSEDPTAFDSLKIGNARVHRYSRDNEPDSEIEYVMWYHGRSKLMSEDPKYKSLAPLSTGQIGRATSKNGLVWQKDEAGSASEEGGVSLGINKDAWWAFDTAHVGLGSVLLPMTTPAVLAEGGVYLMYYFGGNFESSKAGDYLGNSLIESLREAPIEGMKMKIGVALSQNGVTWGRVEGDHFSGACVFPYDSSDPNSRSTSFIEGIEEELYCAWPEVFVDTSKSSGTFTMYYSTATKVDKAKCIGVAVSDDGFRWSKGGVCLRPDPTALDEKGCARCCVVRDASFDQVDLKWIEEDGLTMYYEGVAADGKHRILWAKSKDGRQWEKRGLALDAGSEGAWDHGGVGAPHVLRLQDGTQRMYYTGQATDGKTSIGVAKLAASESVGWIREKAAISFL